MPRNVGTGGVNNFGQLYRVAEVPLDELGPKLTLHEGVGSDLSDHAIATSLGILALGQLEEPLSERNRQCVFPRTSRIQLSIQGVKTLVLDRDVRRIPHHDVVTPRPQHLWVLAHILRSVLELGQLIGEVIVAFAEQATLLRARLDQ